MGDRWRQLTASAGRQADYVRAQVAGLAKSGSHQRLQVRQIAKATLAAVLAWLVASRLLPSQATWIAPATAVIMVHATVYQTLTNGLRRVAAVAAGVMLAGAVGYMMGLGVLSLTLIVPPALLAARWHRMGRHGSDVATTAVLMLSFGAASEEGYLLGYVVATAIGALSGMGVNLLLWPPLYRDRPVLAVRRLGRESAALLGAMAEGLRDGWNLSELPEWERQAVRLDEQLTAATTAVADRTESRRYNLRLRLHPRAVTTDPGPVLHLLTSAAAHVHAIVHALSYLDHPAAPGSGPGSPAGQPPDVSDDYARDYADLLDLLAEALTSRVRRGDPAQTHELIGRAQAQAVRIHERMTSEIRHGQVEHPGGWALSGSLLTDADRILALLSDSQDTLPGRPVR
ncbi:Aromatic acid exporter family member 1 [Nonomuraea solani]|uniref:Aromatic acid exporter family member 1 n=1 Tax=Nonomuraea solani TaxID=1144553 RepID=A0A1H6EWH2_9ACTN|nr:Aromatic acid exporter family member 1 [Nonomuraea solani]